MRKFLVFLSLAMSTHAFASETCGAKFASDHPLRLEIEKLEAGVHSQSEKVSAAEQDIQKIARELQQIRSEMGFREKHLWRWVANLLGGDTAKIDAASLSSTKNTALQTELEQKRASLSDADRKVVTAIEEYLKQNDALYRDLNTEAKGFYDVVCAGNECIQALDSAISDVDDAQFDDMLGMITDNKFIEVMAALDTSTASDSIQSAKAKVHVYVQHLDALKHEIAKGHGLTNADHITEVDPTVQLVVDFVTGSSFMDIFNYFALSDAEDQLQDMKGKIKATHDKIELAHQKLVEQLQGKVCQIREQCAPLQ